MQVGTDQIKGACRLWQISFFSKRYVRKSIQLLCKNNKYEALSLLKASQDLGVLSFLAKI